MWRVEDPSPLKISDTYYGTGEMAQYLRALAAHPEVLSSVPSNSGSQPSTMRSGALFWPAGRHTDRILYTQ